MNNNAILEPHEEDALRGLLSACANEPTVTPDWDDLQARIERSPAVAAPPALAWRDEPANGDGPRRFRWLLVAAATAMVVGGGVVAAIRLTSHDRVTTTVPSNGQDSGIDGTSQVAEPGVHTLVGSAPLDLYAGVAGDDFSVGTNGDAESASIGTTRYIRLVVPGSGEWWVIGRAPASDVPSPEGANVGKWSGDYEWFDPNGQRRWGDGAWLTVTPAANNSGGNAAPKELLDWASANVTAGSIGRTLDLPDGWSAIEQEALQLWLSPDGSAYSVENDVDSGQAGPAMSANTLYLPSGINPGDMPRWIFLGEGFPEPTKVTASSGATGWLTDRDVVHGGFDKGKSGGDTMYLQINANFSAGTTPEEAVEMNVIPEASAELLPMPNPAGDMSSEG